MADAKWSAGRLISRQRSLRTPVILLVILLVIAAFHGPHLFTSDGLAGGLVGAAPLMLATLAMTPIAIAGPAGVEDGSGTGQVTQYGDAAPDLEDGGVTAGPRGHVPQRTAAGCPGGGDDTRSALPERHQVPDHSLDPRVQVEPRGVVDIHRDSAHQHVEFSQRLTDHPGAFQAGEDPQSHSRIAADRARGPQEGQTNPKMSASRRPPWWSNARCR